MIHVPPYERPNNREQRRRSCPKGVNGKSFADPFYIAAEQPLPEIAAVQSLSAAALALPWRHRSFTARSAHYSEFL
jgi:hypothetical protein